MGDRIIMYPMSNETYADFRSLVTELLKRPNQEPLGEIMDLIQEAYRHGCKTGHRIGLDEFRRQVEQLVKTVVGDLDGGVRRIFEEFEGKQGNRG